MTEDASKAAITVETVRPLMLLHAEVKVARRLRVRCRERFRDLIRRCRFRLNFAALILTS
jgi:hypothetical protein